MRSRITQLVVAALVASSGIILTSSPASAAITVQTLSASLTAQQIAQQLAGTGVTVSNVTFAGAPAAAGNFVGGMQPVGFDTGVILSSGNAAYVLPPNDDTGKTQVNGTNGDPQLDALSGTGTHDAAILEFDVVPNATQLFFTYVFGSEEYQEFVNGGVNDVFGFFVGGQNCAVVPGTSTPVSIDTINASTNPTFYRNNDTNPSPFETQLDGLTVPMTCQATVVPNQPNHIKLAIADGGDSVLDSDVFLQAGSFTTDPGGGGGGGGGGGNPGGSGPDALNQQPRFLPNTPVDGTVLHTRIGQTVNLPVLATDPDPLDILTLGVSGGGALGSISPASNVRSATYSLTPTTVGTYGVTLTATDQLGLEAVTRRFAIVVRKNTGMTVYPALVSLPPAVSGMPGAGPVAIGFLFFPNLTARLTDADGVPIAGRFVTFKAAGGLTPGANLCGVVTDSQGFAVCDALLPDPTREVNTILGLGYWAVFDGDGSYAGSTGSGPLLLLQGEPVPVPPAPPAPAGDPVPYVPSFPRAIQGADFDGDGAAEAGVWRPAIGGWFHYPSAHFQWGASGDIPVSGDYNGVGGAERAIWRPSTGVWWIEGAAPEQWGAAGDVPVPADYNGDGKTDIAVWRGGVWWIRGVPSVAWGTPGDIPVPADYNGDGKADIAVFRPSEGAWYMRGIGSVAGFGMSSDIPVPGDYFQDEFGARKAEVALYRPSTGQWFFQNQTIQYGAVGDIPIPADFDGDGKLNIAVWRPAPSSAPFFIRQGTPGILWGATGDVPTSLRPPLCKLIYCMPPPPAG